MRYIEKQPAPEFFKTDTQRLSNWAEYGKQGEKRKAKEHMLEHEQAHLCVYCESKVNLNQSHIEHIKPKAQDMYPHLTFVWENLAVSCNGTVHNPQNDKDPHNCGHKKENEYDEALFIDPTVVTDIRDYFQYDVDDATILPSPKKPQSAQYTINILRLNSARLSKAREITLKTFQNKIREIPDPQQRKSKMLAILQSSNLPFISYLRYRYRSLLTE